MKTVIVIPTYNERANIAKLIPLILHNATPTLEIIIVDDNSPDQTAAIVADWQKIYPQTLHLIKREKKLGLGSAYLAGFQKALAINADLIMEMDADFSHAPADIPRLISACVDGADLAIGSRKITGGQIIGWNWRRKIMSGGAMLLSRFILKLKTHDVTSGFRCYRRTVLTSIRLNTVTTNGYAFQEELLYRVEKKGFTIQEIPVIFTDRHLGKSKLSLQDIGEFFLTIIKLKFKKYAS